MICQLDSETENHSGKKASDLSTCKGSFWLAELCRLVTGRNHAGLVKIGSSVSSDWGSHAAAVMKRSLVYCIWDSRVQTYTTECYSASFRLRGGSQNKTEMEYKGSEMRWDETRCGVKQWRAIRAVVPTTQYFMTHPARHCFTPNRVSSHFTCFVVVELA